MHICYNLLNNLTNISIYNQITGLTFLLIAAVTFALFSQAAEYSTSSQAFIDSVAQYSGVVTVCDEMPVTDHWALLYKVWNHQIVSYLDDT